MAKGQKKSSREAKTQKSAAEKSAAGGKSGSLGIASISSQTSGSSYKERFKKGHDA